MRASRRSRLRRSPTSTRRTSCNPAFRRVVYGMESAALPHSPRLERDRRPGKEEGPMKIALTVAAALLAFAPASDLKVGEPVPDIALGKDGLAALTKQGKVVALYFWSSTCPYGPPNYPNIKDATDRFADHPKVKIFVVSSSGEPEAKG